MQTYTQSRKDFYSFLRNLATNTELIAPTKKDLVRFESISNPDEIYFGKNAYFPLKEFFFKKSEVLFQFDGEQITVSSIPSPQRVFFGVRKCDLNAIRHQDMVFLEDVRDPYYSAARKNSYLLGYHCNTAPSEYCFCGSMNLVDYFDLMFYDRGDLFLVEVGSDKGKELLEKYGTYFTLSTIHLTQADKHIPDAERLKVKDISKLYNHPDWKKGVDICLSCSACTALCPTCYCFDIHDDISLKDPKKGERMRGWSSCQVQEFTRVAGDHVFRKDREQRFKHRIYHQLKYFKEKYGVQMCVGCGRCIEGCPTRIDFVEIINQMPHEKEKT